MSTDTTATSADIDAVFDLAVDSTNTDTEQNSAANGSESDAETSAADAAAAAANPALIYHKVHATFYASEVPDGENPEGTYTVAEFAGHLTIAAIKSGGGLADLVKDQAVYNALKGTRWQLPVVLVFPDGADKSDHRNVSKVYLPIDEAMAAYDKRPARGDSNAAASKRSQDELLTDAAKRAISLANITKRYNRVKEQMEKATALLAKSHKYLTEYYKADPAALEEGQTQEDANKALLNAAITERAAKIEEEEALKADAAKASDIPDDK